MTSQQRVYEKIIRDTWYHVYREDEDSYDEGVCWYSNASEWCENLSKELQIDYIKVCGVLAALSPATSWERNKKDCENLLAHISHTNVVDYACTTYSANVDKAILVYFSDGEKEAIEAIIGKRAFKVKAFFNNIFDPYSREHVTLDRHMFDLLEFNDYITAKRYREMEEAFKRAASGVVNIKPCDIQAVLWVYWRKEKGLK